MLKVLVNFKDKYIFADIEIFLGWFLFVIFVKKSVKYLSICILLISLTVNSQEFGATFITIDEASLPNVFLVEESEFVQKTNKILGPSKTLRVNASNYWQPVSMVEALAQQDSYLSKRNSPKQNITAESLGFRKIVEKESMIQIQVHDSHRPYGNSIRNSVYRDATMPFMYHPSSFRTFHGRGF